MSMLNLNRRQEAFCQAVFEGRSARQAALQAGYSAKSASSIGADLVRLPKVAARIQELREAEQKAREADRRLRRTQSVVFERLRNATSDDLQPITICNPNGQPLGLFLPFSTLIETVINS